MRALAEFTAFMAITGIQIAYQSTLGNQGRAKPWVIEAANPAASLGLSPDPPEEMASLIPQDAARQMRAAVFDRLVVQTSAAPVQNLIEGFVLAQRPTVSAVVITTAGPNGVVDATHEIFKAFQIGVANPRPSMLYDAAADGATTLDPAAGRAAMTASIAAFLKQNPTGVVRLRVRPGQLTAFHKCWDTNGWLGDGRVGCRAALFLVSLTTPATIIKTCRSGALDGCYSRDEQDARAWIKREIAGNDQATAEGEDAALLRRITKLVPLAPAA